MRRRIPWHLRPYLEVCERRELLSAITDIMSANSLAGSRAAPSARQSAFVTASQAVSAGGGSQSIAVPENQGPVLNPDGSINNFAIAPTGTLTRRQVRKQKFAAHFIGTYTVGAGRTSTEANQIFIRGIGTANTMLHSDIQILLVTPRDPTALTGGVSSIFDRNINSNSVVGFDLAASHQDLDKNGLPVRIPTVSLDPDSSAGVYTEGFAVGTMLIHYIPNGKRAQGVISQGTAIVTIQAQIYSPNVNFILRNADINP